MLLCDFHRLQAWNRFMAKGVNGIPTNVADKLMTDYLTPLADSDTETVYRERKMALLNSNIFKVGFANIMLKIGLYPEEVQYTLHTKSIHQH